MITLTREQVVRLAALLDEENTGWESVTLTDAVDEDKVDALLVGDNGRMRSRYFVADDGEVS